MQTCVSMTIGNLHHKSAYNGNKLTKNNISEAIHLQCATCERIVNMTMVQNILFPKEVCTKSITPRHRKSHGKYKENGINLSKISMRFKSWQVPRFERIGMMQ